MRLKKRLLFISILLIGLVSISCKLDPNAAKISLKYSTLLKANAVNVYRSQTVVIEPSGGKKPYTYTLIAGDGSIDFNTGIYQAAATLGEATVLVTDALQNEIAVTVLIVELPPTNLAYANNPVVYTVGSSITANNPTTGGGPVVSFSTFPVFPDGIVLNNSTGAIIGTPRSVSATKVYTITATNTGGSSTTTLSLGVLAAPVAPPTSIVYAQSTRVYTVGVELVPNMIMTIRGGTPTAYAITPTLPMGLFLNPDTGTISGTASAVSPNTNYTITAANNGGSVSTTISITVQ